jgi:uncharacterized protein YvpB
LCYTRPIKEVGGLSRNIIGLVMIMVLTAWLFVRHPSSGAESTKDIAGSENNVVQTSGAVEAGNAVQESPEAITEDGAETPVSVDPEEPAAMHLIDVPIISQLPELYNGCEITSLTMLLSFLQHPVDKLDLAWMLPKDETPAEVDEDGTILVWGDPDQGFVGSIYGDDLGYGVYVKPLAHVLEQVYEPGALDLSGRDFNEIEKTVAEGKPVIIWNIASFEPSDAWVTWKTPEGKQVEATFQEHCVLMVGFDNDYVYVNNPFEEIQAQQVPKGSFIEAWEQMGRKALTFK